jgi:hypothetical protein
MAELEVWDDKTHLFFGEAIYVHFYVYADTSKVATDLQHAFTLQAAIRVGGIQFWDTGRVPLANRPLLANPGARARSRRVSSPRGRQDRGLGRAGATRTRRTMADG